MLHHDEAVGAIAVTRREPGGFTQDEIALLRTFADQALIAIENVRLFTELEARNHDLTEALEQKTATGEILRVISSSRTDLQPVMDAVVESAARLCEADAVIFRRDGDFFERVANCGSTPSGPLGERFRLTRGHAGGRAMIDGATLQIPDIQAAQDEFPNAFPVRTGARLRTILAVPLMREGMAIGVIVVRRVEVRAFSPRQVDLLTTFAEQAVIAIENVRLFTELQEKNSALTESLEQQTATSEILRVISQSPTDVQPVFDTIVRNAVRLCGALQGGVYRFDGELVHSVAHDGYTPEQLQQWRATWPQPVTAPSVACQSIRSRSPVRIRNFETAPELVILTADTLANLLARGSRSVMAVPMFRQNEVIGAISLAHREVDAFSDTHVELLKTFADQAVIAIENVRLFKELEARNRDLTATGEILQVISRSPTNVQPVFDTIVKSAGHLCEATFTAAVLVAGDELTLVAAHGEEGEAMAVLRGTFPRPLGRDTATGRAVLERRPVHLPDVQADQQYHSRLRTVLGTRTILAVPMLREGAPIGAIAVWRHEVRPFTDKQLALLQTFADQAVIAIENVRLFTELRTSNRELTTALDQQTATSDILRAISRSQTDVQPVFDAIVHSAARLLRGYGAALTRIAGEQIELAALTSTDDAGDAAVRAIFPQSLQSEWPYPQAIRNRAPLNITDFPTDLRWPEAARDRARVRGSRSWVVVPMLHHDAPVGTISVIRREPGGFTDAEVALLKTFADQAVIAIENVRLFKELEARTQELTRSVGELRALGEVGQAISSTLDLRTVLSTIVARATQLSGTDAGVIYEYDEPREVFVPRATEHLEAEIVETMLATPVRRGEGATGRLAEIQEPIQVPDILAAPAESRVRGALVRAGYRALLAVPLVREGHLLGGLTVIRKATGAFPPEVVDVLKTFATQSALAIQNARLFHEIADKSQQLEAASRHKSEFLANMSHELRTPLNAIIGFSEVLAQGMFGEINEKQTEYLHDILESGQHLLSLINDILDLSKIEAGRMELELAEFDLPQAIENALTLVRERALRRGIALHHVIHDRVADIRADERKVKQVLLNLLSNAIKFTFEGGRIDVRAAPADGLVEVSVTDSGVGIAPEDQEAVFEEFRQVGTADKKAEGTGLGLALSRKFIELHGGKIWVTSQVGVGSTFTFTLPMRGDS
jgi:GAF domain-containing protein